MKKKLKLLDYQIKALNFLKKEKSGAIFIDPGGRKTAIVLNYLDYLKRKLKKDFKALIIAPLNVIYDPWTYQPFDWWKTLDPKKICNIHEKEYDEGHDVYLINPNKITSEIKKNKKYLRQFSVIVIDESVLYKNPEAKRTMELHRYFDVIKPKYSVIMTGEPVTKNLLDIYAQFYFIDRCALGSNFYAFRSTFFEPSPDGYNWVLRDGAYEEIIRRISKKSFILDEKTKKKIGYPKTIFNDVYFSLSKKNYKKYFEFHKKFMLELDELLIDKSNHKGKVYSGAISYTYCSQFVCGYLYEPKFKYDDKGNILARLKSTIHHIHEDRVKQLKSLTNELNGKNLLVFYETHADLEQIKKLKLPNSAYIQGGMKASKTQEILKQWNAGKITNLFGQISMISTGLNLQHGGHNILFYNVPHDYDLYKQAIHRLKRPGQKHTVTIHRFICRKTVDEIRRLQILEGKIFNAKQFKEKMLELMP